MMLSDVLFAALCGLSPAATAQAPPAAQEEATEVVNLRVTSLLPNGSLLVDRGEFDGLAVGDRIVFRPRGGAQSVGTVEDVSERSSAVRIVSGADVLPLGAPGEARVPTARFDEPEPEAPAAVEPAPAAPTAPAEPSADAGGDPAIEALPEHPGWSNTDPDYAPGSPLLTRVIAVQPADRAPSFSGRVWTSLDQIWTTEEGRGDAFYRLGSDALFENPFGRGGELQVDLEANWRNAARPDEDDDAASRLRIDRLNYRTGNHRFSDNAWSIGRMLQSGVPEFGWLDGVEYGHQLESGDRMGVSAGFMPEPNLDFESGHDSQIAAYYTWVHDSSERLEATLGFQKTWHDLEPDRDLLVAKFDYLPHAGWYWRGTAWIDFFTGGDEFEDDAFDFSQIYLATGRQFEEYGIDFRYTHFEFPELLRDEFLPVEPDQLLNDHWDRLRTDMWVQVLPALQIYAGAGLFADEDESGGDLLMGLGIDDFLFDGVHARVESFLTHGEFNTSFGGRASLSSFDAFGSWEVFFESLHNDADGFAPDNDDLIQSRLRARRDFTTASGWSLSGYVEGVDYETEQGLLAGLLVERSF